MDQSSADQSTPKAEDSQKSIVSLLSQSANLLSEVMAHGWTGLPDEQIKIKGMQVGRLLARGGMSRVYQGKQLALSRDVAIKLLPPELALKDSKMGERFHQEACALARLAHPNIVKVFDYGQTEEGDLYLVMELLEGQPLSQVIKQGPLPLSQSLEIVEKVARALAYAHQKELIHRDIKPSNIFLSPQGWVTVLDFGLVRAVTEESSFLTRTGLGVGTPEYAAPEQVAADKKSDARVDIYSLAVVAYELLTGMLPRGHMPQPSSLSLTPLPPALDSLVLQCLDPRPEKRPASMEVFIECWTAAKKEIKTKGLKRRSVVWATSAACLATLGLGYSLGNILPIRSRKVREEFSFQPLWKEWSKQGKEAEEDRLYRRLEEILAKKESWKKEVLSLANQTPDVIAVLLELHRLEISFAVECGQLALAEQVSLSAKPVLQALGTNLETIEDGALGARWFFTQAAKFALQQVNEESLKLASKARVLFTNSMTGKNGHNVNHWWFAEAGALEARMMAVMRSPSEAVILVNDLLRVILSDDYTLNPQLGYGLLALNSCQAELLLSLGKDSEAEAIALKGLDSLNSDHFEKMWPRGRLGSELQVSLQYVLARVYENKKDWSKAFSHAADGHNAGATRFHAPWRYRSLLLDLEILSICCEASIEESKKADGEVGDKSVVEFYYHESESVPRNLEQLPPILAEKLRKQFARLDAAKKLIGG